METVIFDGEDGTELEFGILEQTRVGGINYLLVIDPEENDAAQDHRHHHSHNLYNGIDSISCNLSFFM